MLKKEAKFWVEDLLLLMFIITITLSIIRNNDEITIYIAIAASVLFTPIYLLMRACTKILHEDK